jgi:glycosyltransferase involved in cell wall biosynthesis
MYCGACHRDLALFAALGAMGEELAVIPLYTPLRTDEPAACSMSPIFMGGVSLYLQMSLAMFGRLPAIVRRQLDRPALLRGVSRLAVQTAPEKLGRLTVSVLLGEQGPHAGEIDRLVQFLKREVRPDIVNLSNMLLASLAPPIRRELGVPVVSTLQGEEAFVAGLSEPYRRQAMDLLRQHAASIDRFICCARERVAPLADWLGVPAQRIAAIPTGLDAAPFAAMQRQPRAPGPPTIGYLSAIRPEKGLDVLVGAVAELKRLHHREVHLTIAGQVLDRAFWKRVRKMIDDAGLCVTIHGELDLRAKVDFLHRCDLFVMPTRLHESRAVAAMEAIAAGVPVIASARGVLPELLDTTEGGFTVEADDPLALARGIMGLLDDPAAAKRHSQNGPANLARHYLPRAMAQRTVEEYRSLVAKPITDHSPTVAMQ